MLRIDLRRLSRARALAMGQSTGVDGRGSEGRKRRLNGYRNGRPLAVTIAATMANTNWTAAGRISNGSNTPQLIAAAATQTANRQTMVIWKFRASFACEPANGYVFATARYIKRGTTNPSRPAVGTPTIPDRWAAIAKFRSLRDAGLSVGDADRSCWDTGSLSSTKDGSGPEHDCRVGYSGTTITRARQLLGDDNYSGTTGR